MRTPQLNRATVAAGLAAVAVLAAPGAAQATAALPKVPEDLSATLKYLVVKPGYIGYTGDGTGVLQGRGNRGAIHWTSWTSTSAVGTGYDRIDTCRNSCAGGPFNEYPVKLEAWRPGVVHGQLVFTRLTRWYTGRQPPKSTPHFTWTDLYQYGGWGFSPPDAAGYCTETMGQPRAAGCANITALP